jgi:hypothetical protein
MIEVGSRMRNQPPPPRAVFEALAEPNRDPSRPWLELNDDEVWPKTVAADRPRLLVWSSLWTARPDARIRYDIEPDERGGTNLRWTVHVDEPQPDAGWVGHVRYRMNFLINAQLRYSFGQ